jgi:excisionase family DNA binding protein
MTSDLLNARQVARILNCDYKTVIAKAARGEIPGAKFGRAWAFRASDIEAYIDAEISKQTEKRRPPSDAQPVAQPPQVRKRRGHPRTILSP